ncbi:hypothetical protein F5888DRAFT_1739547 [Russula emetica]|nr:hypothetical protein F5888DRAFT_1739547 [Russula emetica]
MFFLFLHLFFSGPSLCIISVSLHFVFNPIHKHVHSYRHHAILVLIPMPYLIVATSCRFFFFFHLFSLLQWAIVASIWVKVFLLLTHTPSSFSMH